MEFHQNPRWVPEMYVVMGRMSASYIRRLSGSEMPIKNCRTAGAYSHSFSFKCIHSFTMISKPVLVARRFGRVGDDGALSA